MPVLGPTSPAEQAASIVALTGVALPGWIWARLEGSRRSRPSTTYSRACPKRPESAEVTMPASGHPSFASTLPLKPHVTINIPNLSCHVCQTTLQGTSGVSQQAQHHDAMGSIRILTGVMHQAARSPVNAPKETKRAEVCRNAARQAPLPADASAAKALAKGAAGSSWAAGAIAHSTSASSTYSTHAIEVAPIMPRGMSTDGFFTCMSATLKLSGGANA